ncbi:MAG: hypothetical protein HQL76_01870 [Magnetococcales bacterium]|nr:hypothetical protein [Magnetococcales bacterium]
MNSIFFYLIGDREQGMGMNNRGKNTCLIFTWILSLVVLVLFGCGIPAVEITPDVQQDDTKEVVSVDTGVPVWTVGERWEYSDGYVLEVESISRPDGSSLGDHESYPPEERLTRFKVTPPYGFPQESWSDFWMVCKGFFKVESKFGDEHRKNVFLSEKLDKLFPLAVGKVINYDREFLRNRELIKHRSSWRVTGYQPKVTVADHDYGCWILEWNTDSLQSNWSGHETWWYCPEINNYARMEFRYGDNEVATRVLIKYHHPYKRDKKASIPETVGTMALPMEPNRN